MVKYYLKYYIDNLLNIYIIGGDTVLGKEMKVKSSLRFFDNIPVRAVWYEQTSQWLYSCVDLCNALTNTSNARRYWNDIKRRKPQLSANCVQLKLPSNDGKKLFNRCC